MSNPTFDRKRGVIKTIFRAKQYGFIQVTPKEEYFFHGTALQGVKFSELVAGDAVSFIPTTSKEGKLRAVGIRRFNVDSGSGNGALPGKEAPVPEETGRIRKPEDAE